MPSPSYYARRFREKLVHRLIAAGQPDGTRFALAAYSPGLSGAPIPTTADENTAFVFQGLIASDLDATLAGYRRLFPRSPIIIATWENEREALAALPAINVDPLIKTTFLRPPARRGIMNVNMQICSAGRGIALAAEAFPAVRRVAKIRIDCPPRRPDAIFPIIDHFDGGPETAGRIWGVDINTSATLPFSFSDIFQVGPIAAMLDFWALDELDDREMSPKEFLARTHGQTDLAEIIRLQPPEVFLTLRYLRRRGVAVRPDSLEDYREALARHFGVLDADQIGLAFDKYTPWRNGRSPQAIAHKTFVSFPEWLQLSTAAGGKS